MNRFLIVAALFAASAAQAKPAQVDDVKVGIDVPKPTLASVMKSDLLRAQIRFSKILDGKRVSITVGGGSAERMNPNWAPGPSSLKYGLARNRALVKTISSIKLGSPRKEPSESAKD